MCLVYESRKLTSCGKRNFNFKLSWFDGRKLLAYSRQEDDIYFKFCIFCSEDASSSIIIGIDNSIQTVGKLSENKSCKLKDAVEVF